MNRKVTICSVGDLMICDSPLYASIGVGSRYPEIKERLFDDCREAFDAADVVIGNLETVVYQPRNRSLKESQMACSSEMIGDLKAAGFSILNLANNHSMQHGIEGFIGTKTACEQHGIDPIGIRDEKPHIVQINGIRMAFLSLCIHIEWYEPNHILYENRIEKILNDVRKLRKEDDSLVIIVTAHWGDEFATYPSNAQIALAHKLIEIGADIILGHHSHVYQGIEEYRNGIVVYSQGNFVSDMVPELCRQSGIVCIDIDKQGGKKISYRTIPCHIGDDYIPRTSDENWMDMRQTMLQNALDGNNDDEKYWKDIKRNHDIGHGQFKTFFKNSIRKYHPAVSSRMLIEFCGRKIRRIIGTTTDGQVSSMDPEIMKAINQVG